MSDNRFYSLQEVSAQCGLAPYILRYWELHFPELTADKSKPKHMYGASDIALINRIKKLLYVEHLTIEQAKGRLKEEMAFPVKYAGAAEKAQPAAEPAPAPAPAPAAEPEPTPAPAPVQAQPAAEESAPAVSEEPAVEVKAEETAHAQPMPADEIHRAAAQELATLRAQVESLKAELEEQRGKADSARELLAVEAAKLVECTQALETEQGRSQALEEELTLTKSELEAQKAARSTLEAELQQMTSGAAESAADRAAELEKLGAENAALRGKVSGFVEELRALSTVLAKTH